MQKNYKYDIALSFATEDLSIAESIYQELKSLEIECYYYPEQNNLGKDLLEESWRVYREESLIVLMIVSEHYVRKKWSDLERQIAQTTQRDDHSYILPLRLDQTSVEGLSSNIIYLEWNNDPKEVATQVAQAIIKSKLNALHQSEEQKAANETPLSTGDTAQIETGDVNGIVVGISKKSTITQNDSKGK